ncbi:MAG: hypothetical protein IEMM0007_0069 [bacterium]|nr:MAG: hypothetical protein IEMM0007_0069 [bacterium]
MKAVFRIICKIYIIIRTGRQDIFKVIFLKSAIAETLSFLVPAGLYVAGKHEGLNCTGDHGIHKSIPVEKPAGKNRKREGSRFFLSGKAV